MLCWRGYGTDFDPSFQSLSLSRFRRAVQNAIIVVILLHHFVFDSCRSAHKRSLALQRSQASTIRSHDSYDFEEVPEVIQMSRLCRRCAAPLRKNEKGPSLGDLWAVALLHFGLVWCVLSSSDKWRPDSSCSRPLPLRFIH